MGNIEKQLRNIPEKDRERIFAAIEQLMARDFSALDRKRLKGYEHIFRIRVGSYRVIYYDDGADVILKAVLRRNESTYSRF